MPDKIYLGQQTETLETGVKPGKISRVNLNVDSENYYTSGDNTGRTIEVTCIWGSQTMADTILAGLKDYDYQPYTAENTLLDVAAEVGDGVTIGGIYSMIAQSDITFDGMCAASISAPVGDEIDDEYPYQSTQERTVERQIAYTRSLIKKTSEEILLQVDDMDEQISAISTKLDSITLSVSNGSTSSTITLKAGETAIASQSIKMDGLVTLTGLSGGTTTIDGACIKTGTISASRLELTNYATNASVTSAIEALEDGLSLTATSNKDGTTSTLTLKSDGVSISSTSITFSGLVTFTDLSTEGSTTIYGGNIDTETLAVDNLYGRYIYLRDRSGTASGRFDVTSSSSSNWAIQLESYSAMRIVADDGALYLSSYYDSELIVTPSYLLLSNGDASIGGDGVPFRPSTNGTQTLGTSAKKWSDVYSTNGTIQTSDAREKTDITYGLDEQNALFDVLKPCTYRFLTGTRRHNGMIAQDLEEELTACGISPDEYAAFIKTQDGDDYIYAMRYTEFIPLLIDQVQKLKARVATLEGKA